LCAAQTEVNDFFISQMTTFRRHLDGINLADQIGFAWSYPGFTNFRQRRLVEPSMIGTPVRAIAAAPADRSNGASVISQPTLIAGMTASGKPVSRRASQFTAEAALLAG